MRVDCERIGVDIEHAPHARDDAAERARLVVGQHEVLVIGIAVAREMELVDRLVEVRSTQGSVPGTVEAWLALRGLRTLHLRVERASANAADLAARLATHPTVSTVHYPGLGAMVSIELDRGPEDVEAIVGATRLWVHATSLGGVESSLERRRRWAGESSDVPESLIRLSVGIEDVEDLWHDLSEALSVLG